MNGPQHYREAEKLLAYVNDGALQDGVFLSNKDIREITARAQVHATLAQTAAAVLAAAAAAEEITAAELVEWDRTVGVLADLGEEEHRG